jgi:hypothetical protein
LKNSFKFIVFIQTIICVKENSFLYSNNDNGKLSMTGGKRP